MGFGKPVIDGGMTKEEYDQVLSENRAEQARLEEERRIAAEQREAERQAREDLQLQEQKQEELRLEKELDKAEAELLQELNAQQAQRQMDGLTIDFFGSLMNGISTQQTAPSTGTGTRYTKG